MISIALLFFRLDEFMAGFNTISLKLKEMYQVCDLRSVCIACVFSGYLHFVCHFWSSHGLNLN